MQYDPVLLWGNITKKFLCDCRRDICEVFISPLFVIAKVEEISSLEEKTMRDFISQQMETVPQMQEIRLDLHLPTWIDFINV